MEEAGVERRREDLSCPRVYFSIASSGKFNASKTTRRGRQLPAKTAKKPDRWTIKERGFRYDERARRPCSTTCTGGGVQGR